MVSWSALPLNTIVIIISLSLLISIILTVILIKIKRHEETGWVLGVFLIILSSIAFLYLIPYEIVDNARIPEDYIWEDEGDIYYWERNTFFYPEELRYKIPMWFANLLAKRDPIEETFIGKEVIHVTKFNKFENSAVIHDALYDKNGEIFSVLNNQEEISEWYEIDTLLNSLQYVNVEGGHMGIPSDMGSKNVIRVGWVESNGQKDGSENVVLVREMRKIKTGYIDGLELAVWQSDVSNTPIVWHGGSYICDETLRLTVHPKTGYIVNVYRHLVLSAYLSKFLELYYPDLYNTRFITRFLKTTDPIGEAAELIYETTEESQARHIAEAKSLEASLTYYPIIICLPIFIIGLALIWRYGGRSYYWKRYKDFENHPALANERKPKKVFSSRNSGYKKLKKIIAIFIGFILVFTSFAIAIQITITKDGGWFLFDGSQDEPLIEETPPTPPGTRRGIDSGRHVLEATDEGPHKLARREWWYFNVFFNSPGSDLKDWSMIISFNKMALLDIRFLKRDNFFMILYDDKDVSYNFNILNQRRGTLSYTSPGVDVKFKDSWAKGTYPKWQVHGENKEKDFTVDLTYTADFLPVWVEGRSSNLLIGKHMSGDYYVPRCSVEGTIKWDGKEYIVYGIGYYDHVWEGNIPRFVTKGWDWINLHFDNGWEMYLSKFVLRWPRNTFAGALIISPDNRNMIEWDKFTLEYVETKQPQSLPSLSYPVKYHLEASKEDMILKLDITLYNVREIVFKLGRTGMFEGPCYAKGTFSWDGQTVELNGYGMSEVTRVKYFIDSILDSIPLSDAQLRAIAALIILGAIALKFIKTD
jgi:predicted secreted hydrolase